MTSERRSKRDSNPLYFLGAKWFQVTKSLSLDFAVQKNILMRCGWFFSIFSFLFVINAPFDYWQFQVSRDFAMI